jgi:hypothetical protein
MVESTKKYKYKNKGVTLLFAIILVTVFLIIGTGIINLVIKQLGLSSTGKESSRAYYAAETAAECARYWDLFGAAFGKSDGTSGADTVWITDHVKCNSDRVTNVVTSGTTIAVTEFDIQITSLPSPLQAHVKITRDSIQGIATVETLGRNTPNINDPRRVQREYTLTYTVGLCGFSGDAVILLDSSGSINQTEYNTLIAAAQEVIKRLLPPSGPVTQISVIGFQGDAKVLQTSTGGNFFTNDSSKINTSDAPALNPAGATNLTVALRYAHDLLLGQIPKLYTCSGGYGTDNLCSSDTGDYRLTNGTIAGVNFNTPKLVIVLTDGQVHATVNTSTGSYSTGGTSGDATMQSQALTEATSIKNDSSFTKGVQIYTIGFGSAAKSCGGYANCANYLRGTGSNPINSDGIASNPSKALQADCIKGPCPNGSSNDVDHIVNVLLPCASPTTAITCLNPTSGQNMSVSFQGNFTFAQNPIRVPTQNSPETGPCSNGCTALPIITSPQLTSLIMGPTPFNFNGAGGGGTWGTDMSVPPSINNGGWNAFIGSALVKVSGGSCYNQYNQVKQSAADCVSTGSHDGSCDFTGSRISAFVHFDIGANKWVAYGAIEPGAGIRADLGGYKFFYGEVPGSGLPGTFCPDQHPPSYFITNLLPSIPSVTWDGKNPYGDAGNLALQCPIDLSIPAPGIQYSVPTVTAQQVFVGSGGQMKLTCEGGCP